MRSLSVADLAAADRDLLQPLQHASNYSAYYSVTVGFAEPALSLLELGHVLDCAVGDHRLKLVLGTALGDLERDAVNDRP